MAKKATRKEKTYLDLLMEDHRKVESLFKKFEKTESKSEKREIVATVVRELEIHTQVEEEIAYPEFRKFLEEDLIDEADVEHEVAKRLMAELAEADPGDDHYDAKVMVLSEIIDHHIEEEEDEIFPEAQKAEGVMEVTERFIQRRRELVEEHETVGARL